MRNRLVRPALLAGAVAGGLAGGRGGVIPAVAQGEGRPPTAADTSWVTRSALYEVFVQDFSPQATFKGVAAGLDRIEASGANVVWLMPVHPIGAKGRKGTLGSPYAARDYRAVNPAYGTGADLHRLIEAIHAKGMKVILDWVPDHTSPDHPWVKAHPDYYVRDAEGQPSVPRDPDGKLTDWTDVRQLDYRNPAVRREMVATMRWWLQEFGLDGFRVDVAGFLPIDFWREAVPALRAAVPRPILLLAEWDDLELHRAGFDLTYGWGSYKRLKAIWGGASATTYIEGELPDMRAMPPGGARMRFTTNHDETAWDNPPLVIFKGSAGARAAFVAAALLPGRPLLYNGQEVESGQKLALFERGPIVWQQPHASEARSFYRKVIHLARTEPSLVTGELAAVRTSVPADVIAFRRAGTVVLVNPRTRPLRFAVSGTPIDGATDLLSGRKQHGDSVALPSYGAMVLKGAP